MEAERRNPQFDEIVNRLVAEDSSFDAATRTPFSWNTAARTALIVAAGLAWAGLSVLMVVWGWPGVLVAVLAIIASIMMGVRLSRGGALSQMRGRQTGGAKPTSDEGGPAPG
ncbi:MAG: hypothetical protein SYR96_19070 [Actinomycetota bacterium]|nr:hypothetical protein [Actinomycetota bacterium]